MRVSPRRTSAGNLRGPAGPLRLPTRDLPLQSLSSRSFSTAAPKARCLSTSRRLRADFEDPAPPVTWQRHSLRVAGSYRVYPPAVATYWFVTSTSAFRLSTWLLSLSYRRLPRLLPTPNISPHELHLSLRALGPFARPFSVASSRSADSLPGSSPEVSRPSSASSKDRLPTAGLPRPLRSTFAVSHDLDGLLRSMPSPGIAPGNTHGILALQGYSRVAGSYSISEVPVPSWRFREQLRFERGPEGPCHSPAPTGSYSTSRPLPSASGFPSTKARSPLGLFLWDLASAVSPKGEPFVSSAAVRPRHGSWLKKSEPTFERDSRSHGKTAQYPLLTILFFLFFSPQLQKLKSFLSFTSCPQRARQEPPKR